MTPDKAKEIINNQTEWPLKTLLQAGRYWEARGFLKGIDHQKKKAETLMEYLAHKDNCILSFYEAGEPYEGGYRVKFKGKWYKNNPECDCGLDKLLAAYEKNNE